MKKYLIIDEDGGLSLTDDLSDEDLQMVDEWGTCQIIRFSDQKEYYQGDWHEIESYD